MTGESAREQAISRARERHVAHREDCGIVFAKREHNIWLDCTCDFAIRFARTAIDEYVAACVAGRDADQ